MANIPKKALDRFIKAVPRFQKVLQTAKDRDVNESDTVSVINDVFAEVFGYDKYLEVTREVAIRGTYCDLALKVEDKIQFLIEAKAIGMDLKDAHMRQAIDYGANHGIQWVVLTNGIDWRVYRIRFEQPISSDLVCDFDFLALNPKDEKDQECLFILSKEGLSKNVRDEFYDKAQSVNRYVVGSLILGEPILSLIRRELKRLSEGVKIEVDEIEAIVRDEVLKREVVEGDEAEAAKARVNKFYKKGATRPRRITEPCQESAPSQQEECAKESSIPEAEEEQAIQQTDRDKE
jgi:predicted type IV restriction endonuclease